MKNILWKHKIPLGVTALLVITGLLAAFSSAGDSPTNDEVAHIAAGYSYLVAQDYRLNPEHPPLVKDLAAIPLLFFNLNFPFQHVAWTEYTFGQWIVGEEFLYNSGNDPDEILFWARLPMILLFLSLGLFVFYWTKKFAGYWAALLSLFLFLFSPTLLAHGRLVTTDIGATFGFVVSIFFFLRFLDKPDLRNVLFAGVALGVALLLKFSTVALLPYLVILGIIYIAVQPGEKKSLLLSYGKRSFGVLFVAVFLIGAVYQTHIIKYPVERHQKDAKNILAEAYAIEPEEVFFKVPESPLLRPYAHYALGFLRTTRRVGNITPEYFLGQVSGSGWWYYFPVLYLFKIPFALHVLSFLALIAGFLKVRKGADFSFPRIRLWLKENFFVFTIASFVVFYAALTITIAVNIGIRHLLPIFPFVFILVALGIKKWVGQGYTLQQKKGKIAIVTLLLGWYGFSSLSAFPHYLSYYNEIAGGTENGYRIALSSNYDWSQDVKRLGVWANENNVDTMYADIFGKGEPAKYYLEQRYVPWKSSWEWTKEEWDLKQGDYDLEDFPKGNYLAVSANLVYGGAWDEEKIVPHYPELQKYDPVARAGKSIFIYYIK